MAYGCEFKFDAERAAGMQEMIERATGLPCPCKRGEVCLLLPRELKPVTILEVAEPAVRLAGAVAMVWAMLCF